MEFNLVVHFDDAHTNLFLSLSTKRQSTVYCFVSGSLELPVRFAEGSRHVVLEGG